jgi:CRISPR-associated protein (TIGR03986 family)
MPGKPDKPHRIRVRTLDGKPRDAKELNKLKSNQLGMPHLDIHGAGVEFIVCAVNERQIEAVHEKLDGAGLVEVEGGDITIPASAAPRSTTSRTDQSGRGNRRGTDRTTRGGRHPGGPQGRGGGGGGSLTPETDKANLKKKPYGFVGLPAELTTATPVWHDGTTSAGRLSGEIRFEIEALTPLLVGWARQALNDADEPWRLASTPVGSGPERSKFVAAASRATYPDATDSDEEQRRRKQRKVDDDRTKYIRRWENHVASVDSADWTVDSKSVLCPLRAPWGERPVIIPGDSLKGLLRHELGALLGAPMERVAERSYSYRPNSMFAQGAQIIPRIARVPNSGVAMKPLAESGPQVRVPTKLELLPADLQFDSPRLQQKKKRGPLTNNFYRFDDGNGAPYRGGQGAGEKLNSKRNLHKKLTANPGAPTESVLVPQPVQEGYLATLRHLTDDKHGHFSERHPDGKKMGEDARTRILHAASNVVFQPGDLIWIEWDTQKNCMVSLGWHYYYRWAYADTVRRKGGALERHGLFPLPDERVADEEGTPQRLSAVRRLFGYTGDNDGSTGIGKGDHEQLMGRLFPNAAVEVVESGDTDESRFLKPTFLKELGMPRPSAVEHYLKQPHHPNQRPSDRATLVTYGDAAGYDQPGELAGRKFYLDRADAHTGEPWQDDSDANRLNDRSTLALEASKPGRRFRFTLRFRDLDPAELAAVLVALCPDQFKAVLGGAHAEGYCSKLGYARPLGWGSVRIEAKALLWLAAATERPTLTPEADLSGWVRENHAKTASQDEWLAIHRRRHPDAADYPRLRDRDDNENIYTFHTTLRAEHSRARRYRNGEES